MQPSAVAAAAVLLCIISFEDWGVHKKYCKRLVYVKKSELAAFVASTKKADQGSSAAYQAALQAAADDSSRSLVMVTPIVAQNFAKVCMHFASQMPEMVTQ
jgi:hypothetical protein